ncbi:hypothetical protein PR048_018310 [Dryococelus australis]|uniref:Transposable element P transposase-like RNase H domain-containing protein n=1 Tax=Dryococelus australis TaxID=614101 RepID=A0ABQ9HC33_9NEOP|nr:hypothetical protein PR048_018310 [Dryococelus australis]
MSRTTHRLMNSRGKKIWEGGGYRYAFSVPTRRNKLANQVTVVMMRGSSKHFKQGIGYFVTDGPMSAETVKHVIEFSTVARYRGMNNTTPDCAKFRSSVRSVMCNQLLEPSSDKIRKLCSHTNLTDEIIISPKKDNLVDETTAQANSANQHETCKQFLTSDNESFEVDNIHITMKKYDNANLLRQIAMLNNMGITWWSLVGAEIPTAQHSQPLKTALLTPRNTTGPTKMVNTPNMGITYLDRFTKVNTGDLVLRADLGYGRLWVRIPGCQPNCCMSIVSIQDAAVEEGAGYGSAAQRRGNAPTRRRYAVLERGAVKY